MVLGVLLLLPPAAGDVGLVLSPVLGDGGSDGEKSVQELREILTSSLATRDKVERDRMVLKKFLYALFVSCLNICDYMYRVCDVSI